MTSALVAPTINLRVPAGARFRRVFTAPLDSSGEPLDVTGWSGRGQIRATTDSATIYWSWADGQITCDGATVTARIPIAESSVWVWRAGVYQIEVVDPGDPQGVWRVARGTVVVEPWSMDPTATAGDLFAGSFTENF